ncbi:hypothetical protein QAD02_024069 [Eretmocerus hayati]|uniref:Uncharacterized protein n=1 Tax=Eretmocerus hayati TaxID=131215 RepID=A0ACC2PYC6_9HYME|nr:hypothetical protein QAD02_024069 [Eretmocerus hayati]
MWLAVVFALQLAVWVPAEELSSPVGDDSLVNIEPEETTKHSKSGLGLDDDSERLEADGISNSEDELQTHISQQEFKGAEIKTASNDYSPDHSEIAVNNFENRPGCHLDQQECPNIQQQLIGLDHSMIDIPASFSVSNEVEATDSHVQNPEDVNIAHIRFVDDIDGLKVIDDINYTEAENLAPVIISESGVVEPSNGEASSISKHDVIPEENVEYPISGYGERLPILHSDQSNVIEEPTTNQLDIVQTNSDITSEVVLDSDNGIKFKSSWAGRSDIGDDSGLSQGEISSILTEVADELKIFESGIENCVDLFENGNVVDESTISVSVEECNEEHEPVTITEFSDSDPEVNPSTDTIVLEAQNGVENFQNEAVISLSNAQESTLSEENLEYPDPKYEEPISFIHPTQPDDTEEPSNDLLNIVELNGDMPIEVVSTFTDEEVIVLSLANTSGIMNDPDSNTETNLPEILLEEVTEVMTSESNIPDCDDIIENEENDGRNKEHGHIRVCEPFEPNLDVQMSTTDTIIPEVQNMVEGDENVENTSSSDSENEILTEHEFDHLDSGRENDFSLLQPDQMRAAEESSDLQWETAETNAHIQSDVVPKSVELRELAVSSADKLNIEDHSDLDNARQVFDILVEQLDEQPISKLGMQNKYEESESVDVVHENNVSVAVEGWNKEHDSGGITDPRELDLGEQISITDSDIWGSQHVMEVNGNVHNGFASDSRVEIRPEDIVEHPHPGHEDEFSQIQKNLIGSPQEFSDQRLGTLETNLLIQSDSFSDLVDEEEIVTDSPKQTEFRDESAVENKVHALHTSSEGMDEETISGLGIQDCDDGAETEDVVDGNSASALTEGWNEKEGPTIVTDSYESDREVYISVTNAVISKTPPMMYGVDNEESVLSEEPEVGILPEQDIEHPDPGCEAEHCLVPIDHIGTAETSLDQQSVTVEMHGDIQSEVIDDPVDLKIILSEDNSVLDNEGHPFSILPEGMNEETIIGLEVQSCLDKTDNVDEVEEHKIFMSIEEPNRKLELAAVTESHESNPDLHIPIMNAVVSEPQDMMENVDNVESVFLEDPTLGVLPEQDIEKPARDYGNEQSLRPIYEIGVEEESSHQRLGMVKIDSHIQSDVAPESVGADGLVMFSPKQTGIGDNSGLDNEGYTFSTSSEETNEVPIAGSKGLSSVDNSENVDKVEESETSVSTGEWNSEHEPAIVTESNKTDSVVYTPVTEAVDSESIHMIEHVDYVASVSLEDPKLGLAAEGFSDQHLDAVEMNSEIQGEVGYDSVDGEKLVMPPPKQTDIGENHVTGHEGNPFSISPEKIDEETITGLEMQNYDDNTGNGDEVEDSKTPVSTGERHREVESPIETETHESNSGVHELVTNAVAPESQDMMESDANVGSAFSEGLEVGLHFEQDIENPVREYGVELSPLPIDRTGAVDESSDQQLGTTAMDDRIQLEVAPDSDERDELTILSAEQTDTEDDIVSDIEGYTLGISSEEINEDTIAGPDVLTSDDNTENVDKLEDLNIFVTAEENNREHEPALATESHKPDSEVYISGVNAAISESQHVIENVDDVKSVPSGDPDDRILPDLDTEYPDPGDRTDLSSLLTNHIRVTDESFDQQLGTVGMDSNVQSKLVHDFVDEEELVISSPKKTAIESNPTVESDGQIINISPEKIYEETMTGSETHNHDDKTTNEYVVDDSNVTIPVQEHNEDAALEISESGIPDSGIQISAVNTTILEAQYVEDGGDNVEDVFSRDSEAAILPEQDIEKPYSGYETEFPLFDTNPIGDAEESSDQQSEIVEADVCIQSEEVSIPVDEAELMISLMERPALENNSASNDEELAFDIMPEESDKQSVLDPVVQNYDDKIDKVDIVEKCHEDHDSVACNALPRFDSEVDLSPTDVNVSKSKPVMEGDEITESVFPSLSEVELLYEKNDEQPDTGPKDDLFLLQSGQIESIKGSLSEELNIVGMNVHLQSEIVSDSIDERVIVMSWDKKAETANSPELNIEDHGSNISPGGMHELAYFESGIQNADDTIRNDYTVDGSGERVQINGPIHTDELDVSDTEIPIFTEDNIVPVPQDVIEDDESVKVESQAKRSMLDNDLEVPLQVKIETDSTLIPSQERIQDGDDRVPSSIEEKFHKEMAEIKSMMRNQADTIISQENLIQQYRSEIAMRDSQLLKKRLCIQNYSRNQERSQIKISELLDEIDHCNSITASLRSELETNRDKVSLAEAEVVRIGSEKIDLQRQLKDSKSPAEYDKLVTELSEKNGVIGLFEQREAQIMEQLLHLRSATHLMSVSAENEHQSLKRGEREAQDSSYDKVNVVDATISGGVRLSSSYLDGERERGSDNITLELQQLSINLQNLKEKYSVNSMYFKEKLQNASRVIELQILELHHLENELQTQISLSKGCLDKDEHSIIKSQVTELEAKLIEAERTIQQLSMEVGNCRVMMDYSASGHLDDLKDSSLSLVDEEDCDENLMHHVVETNKNLDNLDEGAGHAQVEQATGMENMNESIPGSQTPAKVKISQDQKAQGEDTGTTKIMDLINSIENMEALSIHNAEIQARLGEQRIRLQNSIDMANDQITELQIKNREIFEIHKELIENFIKLRQQYEQSLVNSDEPVEDAHWMGQLQQENREAVAMDENLIVDEFSSESTFDATLTMPEESNTSKECCEYEAISSPGVTIPPPVRDETLSPIIPTTLQTEYNLSEAQPHSIESEVISAAENLNSLDSELKELNNLRPTKNDRTLRLLEPDPVCERFGADTNIQSLREGIACVESMLNKEEPDRANELALYNSLLQNFEKCEIQMEQIEQLQRTVAELEEKKLKLEAVILNQDAQILESEQELHRLRLEIDGCISKFEDVRSQEHVIPDTQEGSIAPLPYVTLAVSPVGGVDKEEEIKRLEAELELKNHEIDHLQFSLSEHNLTRMIQRLQDDVNFLFDKKSALEQQIVSKNIEIQAARVDAQVTRTM